MLKTAPKKNIDEAKPTYKHTKSTSLRFLQTAVTFRSLLTKFIKCLKINVAFALNSHALFNERCVPKIWAGRHIGVTTQAGHERLGNCYINAATLSEKNSRWMFSSHGCHKMSNQFFWQSEGFVLVRIDFSSLGFEDT